MVIFINFVPPHYLSKVKGYSQLFLFEAPKCLGLIRGWLDWPSSQPVRPSIGWLVGPLPFYFYDLYSLTSLLLPEWSSDLKYGPCPPTRDWGSRVSGLVFFTSQKKIRSQKERMGVVTFTPSLLLSRVKELLVDHLFHPTIIDLKISTMSTITTSTTTPLVTESSITVPISPHPPSIILSTCSSRCKLRNTGNCCNNNSNGVRPIQVPNANWTYPIYFLVMD